ncbi:MAG: glycosyltransferase [Magnetococcales bacterium]|nr:glycosyltransferase [Magnetococcales bacterium]MBF0439135.1 glycosyltransferase [Magnetococcales bacterium]
MIDLSVIVVCFNEEQHIGACLDSLVRQTYPLDHYEILVVDGGSRDRTGEIIRACAALHSQVKLIVEPRIGTAVARNTGLNAASHPHIAFIDADCEAPTDWLERLVAYFEQYRAKDGSVVAVGGGNVPPSNASSFVQAVGVAMDSFAGSFNSAQGRQFKTARYVSSLPTLNVLYIKEAILAVGGFDVSLGSEAEDAELNFRLFAQKWRFVLVPDLPVLHKFRPTPAIWYRNMVRYGRGRARLLKRHPSMWMPAYFLPPLFLTGMCSLLLIPLHPLFWSAALYFPAIFLYAAWLSINKGYPRFMFHVASVFIVQHFGYAIGEVFGLLNPNIR